MEKPNPRFLANIQGEPSNILQPIAGYEQEPLLCLEEACEKLYSLINDLPQYIWISKRNCQNPEDGLTQDESASIHLYTMEWPDSQQSLYAKLNRTLRSINRQELKPWFRYLKLFLTALFKLPIVEGVVWRGVRSNLSSQYSITNEQAWWALSSCTLSLKILESPLYLGRAGTRTLFSIETQSGRRIRSHSYFKHEEEIVLLPGILFQVISHLSPADDLHIIHLKEKQAPYSLLQSPFLGAERRQYRSSYIALNSCGKTMLIGSLAEDTSTFIVHTIEVQSASIDGLEINIFGLKSNVKLFKKKVKLFIPKSRFVQLDWNNIDLITFESANDEEDNQRFHFILISIEITQIK